MYLFNYNNIQLIQYPISAVCVWLCHGVYMNRKRKSQAGPGSSRFKGKNETRSRSNQFKGQTEFIIILGLIVVVAVVVVLVYQTGIIDDGPLPTDARTAKDSVENFIRAGAYDTIKMVGIQGGYMAPTASTVKFLGNDVPYWQQDDQLAIPNMETNIVNGIKQYITDNKAALENSMSAQSVTLGEPEVSATILPSKVDLVVYMPTTVGGTSIPQPYTISIPTKLGDIYDFSRNFVAANNEKRYFETYTMSSIVLSPFNDGVQQVPTIVFLTQCGEFVFKNWWDIQPEMKDVIEKTLANTYMPGKAPTGFRGSSSQPKYLLTPLNGKDYSDIDVTFYLPDDFEFTRSNFGFSPEPINEWAKPIPMTGICQSDPVYVNYYVRYPLVVRVEDPLTSNAFQFAVDVAIKDNEPAAMASVSGYDITEQTQLCQNPSCVMSLVVKDSSGAPVPHASVTFMNCPVGRTDASGMLDASLPCGIGVLNAYKQGFDVYDRMYSSDELASADITLTKTPVVNMHLYEVVLDNVSSINEYWIKTGAIRPIDNSLRDGAIDLTVYDPLTYESRSFLYNNNAGTLAGVPAGSHAFSAVLYQSLGTTAMPVNGLLATDFTIREDMDGKDLYMYIPYYPELDTSGGVETTLSAALLTNIMKKCGIGPISETEVSEDITCTITHEEALTIG